MVSLIAQDIESGHGVLFLDPHKDAIDDLLNRYSSRLANCIVLDPEDELYSFGLNLLECSDIANPKLRNDTFAKAKGIFDKLWQNTFEEKPWLQLILQNTIYVFIESQGYTLADFPLFFRDPAFRAFLVGNTRYNRQVYDYWTKTFASKSQRDQDAQMEAAQTRAEIMLAHPYVRDIVGQSRSTLDFNQLIADRKIILLKLSSSLSNEAKKIIGTIVISELLHAVQRRQTRDQFCIFVDEFQNYASFEDFSTLITQAPKFGIATTIAHHERYGQLNQDPGIIGATAAIANKVIFQIAPRDAQELAPEFAEAPPPERKLEEQYVISQSPFYHLLNGHTNPEIRQLVHKYLRPVKERLEDIYGESEAERFIRTDYLDEASLYRIYENIEATTQPHDRGPRQQLLGRSAMAVDDARAQTQKLKSLNEEGTKIGEAIRVLNRLLVDMMEGKVQYAHEEFGKRLGAISKIAVSAQSAKCLYSTQSIQEK